MCEALGIGEVMDRAPRHQPAPRIVTTGDAVHAMVLNGLGGVNPPRSLVLRFLPDNPTSRRLAPVGIEAPPLKEDARGRA
jgi:DNA-binding transcriptional LysR family regulator